jgi:hypothetical protein
MVRFFDGKLFSSSVFSLCPPWPWGFFLEEGEDEKE